ncbi:MAG: hypothetical protein WCJ30_15315, partial [Deltaproteobacteria bacterium]
RILDPRLLGELRAVPVPVATTTVPDSTVPNDRTAVRRAADLLLSSSDATAEVLTIDTASSNATQLVSLRQRATRDAVIYWLASAVVADLDAAYRLTPTSPGVPEVGRIGTMMSNLDQRVMAMSPTYTPLGIARSYVPLLARTSSTDTATNYERVATFANNSVAFARSRQDLATSAARDYDASLAESAAAITAAQSTYIDGIQQLCGSDFAVPPVLPGGPYTFGTRAGDPTPLVSPNLLRCGVNLAGRPVGAIADQFAAIRTAQLQIDAARANEQQLADTITTRSQTIARTHALRVEDIAFRQANNDTIYALGYAKAAADATAAAASDMSGQSALNLGLGSISAAVDFAATFASGALQTEMDKLSNMNDMHAASTDSSVEWLNDMQGLKELMLQTQGLRVQTAIQLNEQARAQTALATMIEGLLRQIDDYRAAIDDAASLLQQDPSVRLQRDHASIVSRQAFLQGRVNVYLAVRALEYETNTPLDQEAQSVFEAQNVGQLETIMSSCVNQAWSGGTGSWLALVGSTSSFTREISVRRDIFGITAPRTDPDTGLTISEGEQFRRQLFARPYQDAAGTVYPAISFATTLSAPGGLFTSTLCNDRVMTIEAQLVGPAGAAGLGDNTAFVSVLANGGSIVRACDSAPGSDVLRSWNLRPPGSLAPAAIQAGVNSYGIAAPNLSLTGYSVAQSQWILAIPDCGTAHENCDVNASRIDDIQLRKRHSEPRRRAGQCRDIDSAAEAQQREVAAKAVENRHTVRYPQMRRARAGHGIGRVVVPVLVGRACSVAGDDRRIGVADAEMDARAVELPPAMIEQALAEFGACCGAVAGRVLDILRYLNATDAVG